MLPPDSSTAPAAPGEPGAAVVVPVYGAAAELDRCLDSIATTTDLARHPLVLVFDGPQPREVEAAVAARAGRFPSPRLLRLPQRRGFPAAANRGLAELPERDAVLVNSDVETTPGWLEKLTVAAGSRPRVASVTPLTNNGTLASVPRWLEENALPAGQTLATFAALVERVSARLHPEIPTGVGFCLYLRREALEAVGPLDESSFGAGYGEEVDWCLRAAERGFRHVLDDGTFVFHFGAASFGTLKQGLEARADRRLMWRHRGWRRRLGEFLTQDPIRPVREKIVEALRPPRRERLSGAPARILHVVHGWPPWSRAGTETYAARLARWQARRRDVAVLARYAPADRQRGSALETIDQGVRVRLLANRFEPRDPRSRNALVDRGFELELARLLDDIRPQIVHIHHLAGHALSLPRPVVARAIPQIWQLQDWWLTCARANRLDRDRTLCSGPAAGKCARCLPMTSLPPAALWNRALYRWRARLARRALSGARAIVAGSAQVIEDHRRQGLLPAKAIVHVLDYGTRESERARAERTAPARPIRLGFVGSAMPHKGLEVLVRALAQVPAGSFRLRFWGAPSTELDAVLAAGGEAIDWELRPPFEEEERPRELAGIDLLVAPSLGLESYGLAVAEALAAGTPALVSDRGALPERVRQGGGAVFAAGDVAALAGELRELAARPEKLAAWSRSIPRVRRFDEHAAELERIYAEVLRSA